MSGARDDLLLQRFGEIAKVVAVARDAYDQVAVRIRFGPGPPERLGVHDVELNVVSVHFEVAAHQVGELLDPGLVGQQRRAELHP